MQSIPLAVLKLPCAIKGVHEAEHCMQSIPLAVLKRQNYLQRFLTCLLHAIHTACGIETLRFCKDFYIF